MSKPLFILITFFLSASYAYSQHVNWEVEFSTKFDNREYSELSLSPSCTRFGVFLASQIGLQWGEHAIMIGADAQRNLGNYNEVFDINPILYYKYDSDRFKVIAGAFPTAQRLGEYPKSFISDEIIYNDYMLEGAAMQFVGDNGYAELVFDWRSMYSKFYREIFDVVSSSKINFSWFSMGYAAMLTHFSHSERIKNVVDYAQGYPHLAFSLSDYTFFDALELKLGWLQTMQRDRTHSEKFVYPNGAKADFTIEKWGFGLYDTFYLGKNLMPYYNIQDSDFHIYGDLLYQGERFYATDSGLYNRAEVYWHLNKSRFLDLKISCVMHLDGKMKMGWQQMATITVNMDTSIWKTLNKRHSR